MLSLSVTKLLLITSIVVLSMLGGIVGLNLMTSVEYNQLRAEETRYSQAQLDFKNARYHVIKIQHYLTEVSATADVALIKNAQHHQQRAIAMLKRLSRQLPETSKEINQLLAGTTALFDLGEKMARTYIIQGRAAGNRIMLEENTGFDAMSDALSSKLDKMAQLLATKVDHHMVLIDSKSSRNHQMTIALSVAATVICSLLLYILFKKIVYPINTLTVSLTGLNSGRGDLRQRLPAEEHEFGVIVSQFNQFIANLQGMVGKISQSIESVISASDSIVQHGEDSSQGAKKQAHETDQVATAVMEMSAAVNEVSNNAAIAMNATKEAEEKAEDGQKIVTNAVESINELAAEVNKASEVIKKLEGYSSDIGRVLDVIREIAEQTNLLALNAAIEAARAGEQGRGFAVVADEVRTLAGRTQNSTEEIQKMIQQLQGAASDAVEVMTRGHDKAARSVDNASKAGEALTAINSSVATITDMNAQIATSSEEQSKVAEEINKNVVSINSVTEKTVDGAENTMQESKKLVALAKELQNLVSQFHV